MGTFTGYLKYKNPDWTQSINKRTKEAWNKGIWSGAEIFPIAASMKIYVGSPFALHCFDGMVIFYEGSNAEVDIPSSGVKYYVTVKGYYVGGSDPVMDFDVIDSVTWSGLSDKEKYIILCTVEVPSGISVVDASHISYEEREDLDVIGRNGFRGIVENFGDLPTSFIKQGDIYGVSSNSNLAIWEGTAWEYLVATQLEEMFALHRGNGSYKNITDPISDEKHLTDNEYDAVTGTISGPLTSSNVLVASQKPFATNNTRYSDLTSSPADYVLVSGDCYVGSGGVGTAKQYFKVTLPGSLGDLTDSLGNLIPILGIYDSTNTTQLNPAIDAPSGFYTDPVVRLDMSSSPLSLFNSDLDVIYGEANNLGDLDIDAFILAGRSNSFQISANNVITVDGGYNYLEGNSQKEINDNLDTWLTHPRWSGEEDNTFLIGIETEGYNHGISYYHKDHLIPGFTNTSVYKIIEFTVPETTICIPDEGSYIYVTEMNLVPENKMYTVFSVSVTPIGGGDIEVELRIKDLENNDPTWANGVSINFYLLSGIFAKRNDPYALTLQSGLTGDYAGFAYHINRPYDAGGTPVTDVIRISDYETDYLRMTNSGQIFINRLYVTSAVLGLGSFEWTGHLDISGDVHASTFSGSNLSLTNDIDAVDVTCEDVSFPAGHRKAMIIDRDQSYWFGENLGIDHALSMPYPQITDDTPFYMGIPLQFADQLLSIKIYVFGSSSTSTSFTLNIDVLELDNNNLEGSTATLGSKMQTISGLNNDYEIHLTTSDFSGGVPIEKSSFYTTYFIRLTASANPDPIGNVYIGMVKFGIDVIEPLGRN
jgi:hypothetical protein